MNEQTKKPDGNIPYQIFSEFLKCAGEFDVPPEVVERLKETIIGKKELSEKAIRAAIFHAEPPQ